jgi:hypothetical protein
MKDRPTLVALTVALGALIAASPAVKRDAAVAGPAPAVAPAASVAAAVAAASAMLDPGLEAVRGQPSAAGVHRSRPAPFRAHVDGLLVPHEVIAVTVLPGAEIRVAVDAGGVGGAAGAEFVLRHDAGEATALEGAGPELSWRWTAPSAPGIHALEIAGGAGTGSVRVNVLVLHPREHVEGDALHGFRIGEYARTPLGGRSEYLPPRGFVQVRQGDENVLVSPHFTLGQFLSKQKGEPRFIAFSTPLALKLEAVLEAVNAAGITTGTFHVMSGFRTPWYNRAIGNTTIYSRHLWGDAADIFIDRDGDGDMDDLNGDGRRDLADARLLAGIVERVESQGLEGVRPGGIGLYRRNAAHGPFVHVDARGYAARW